MKFHIDHDTGDAISGWIVPDNPSEIPRIVVVTHGDTHQEIEIEAFILRPDIVDLGLHSTGIVGFAIDGKSVPGIESLQDLEILEAATRIQIYRRYCITRHTERKLCILNFNTLLQQKLIKQLNSKFTINYSYIEQYSFETTCSIVYNYYCSSIALIGRPLYNRYAIGLSDMQYIVAALLRDPYEELAERLLLLNVMARKNSQVMMSTFANGLESLLDVARSFPFDDVSKFHEIFRRLTPEQREAMMSPMTRCLACNVAENPERRHVSIALENLSQMGVVGTQNDFAGFCDLLNGILGTTVLENFEIETSPMIKPLAEKLSRISIVTDLLEHDLALYSYVEEALTESSAA